MPTPREGESEKDYVSRCIPVVLNEEGKEYGVDHAAAKCHGMYRQWKKKRSK